MNVHSTYSRALEMVTTIGYQRLLELVSSPATKAWMKATFSKYDLDAERYDPIELVTLQHDIATLNINHPLIGKFVQSMKLNAELELIFNELAGNGEATLRFIGDHGLGWLGGNVSPLRIKTFPVRIAETAERLADLLMHLPRPSKMLTYKSLRHQYAEIASNWLSNNHICRGRTNKNSYRGGYSWGALSDDGIFYTIAVVSGQLSDEQKSYVLAHELGHCLHFHSRHQASPIEVLETPELFQEAIADAIAFLMIRCHPTQSGTIALTDEWLLRLNDLISICRTGIIDRDDDNCDGIKDLYTYLMPGISVLLAVDVLNGIPIAKGENLKTGIDHVLHSSSNLHCMLRHFKCVLAGTSNVSLFDV